MAAAAMLLVAIPAHAAIFCIDPVDVPIGQTITDVIQASLQEARQNQEADAIRFRSALILLSHDLVYDAMDGEPAISISGGWNVGCTVRSGPATVLHGQGTARPLALLLRAGSHVTLSHLILHGGLGGSIVNAGGGLFVGGASGSEPATVAVDSVRFSANTALYGGGMFASGNVTVSLRNNVFVDNQGFMASAVYFESLAGEIYITNNTITNNVVTGDAMPLQGAASAAMYVESSGMLHFNNNILWDNPGSDAALVLGSVASELIANDLESYAGFPPAIYEMNRSVDPQFAPCGVPCFDRPILSTSPLVDAGFDAPAGGLPALDILGLPRKMGAHVDIGAYELDEIFVDGFDSASP
jgi:hypothetical protein